MARRDNFLRCIECGMIADVAVFDANPPTCTYCGSWRFTLEARLPPVVDYREDPDGHTE